MSYNKYMCTLCGFIYDEELGCPEDGIAPGTLWADVPEDWMCPECGAMKCDFEPLQPIKHVGPKVGLNNYENDDGDQ